MKNGNRLRTILIVAGFILIFIIAGGFYLSKNPDIITKWKYQRDTERHERMQEILLTASDDCINVDPVIFAKACQQLENYNFENEIDWDAGMSSQTAKCVLQSYRDTTLFMLEYDGDPKSHLANLENGESIVSHLCGIKNDLDFYVPDFKGTDAKAMIDRWHQWVHSEGNYYH